MEIPLDSIGGVTSFILLGFCAYKLYSSSKFMVQLAEQGAHRELNAYMQSTNRLTVGERGVSVRWTPHCIMYAIFASFGITALFNMIDTEGDKMICIFAIFFSISTVIALSLSKIELNIELDRSALRIRFTERAWIFFRRKTYISTDSFVCGLTKISSPATDVARYGITIHTRSGESIEVPSPAFRNKMVLWNIPFDKNVVDSLIIVINQVLSRRE